MDVTLLPQQTDVDLKIIVPALLIFVIAGSLFIGVHNLTRWKNRHSYRQAPETSVGGFFGACEPQSLITQVRGREETEPTKASVIRPPCNDLVAENRRLEPSTSSSQDMLDSEEDANASGLEDEDTDCNDLVSENRRLEPSKPSSQDMLDSQEDASASGLEDEDTEGQAPEEIPVEVTPSVGKYDRLVYWVSRFLKREHNLQLATSLGHEQEQSTPRDHQNRVSPQHETSATALLENRQFSNASKPFGNAVQCVARMVHIYFRDFFRKGELLSNEAIERQEFRDLELGNTSMFNPPSNAIPTFDSSVQLPVVPIHENHCSTLDKLGVKTRGNRENTLDMLGIEIRNPSENKPTTDP